MMKYIIAAAACQLMLIGFFAPTAEAAFTFPNNDDVFCGLHSVGDESITDEPNALSHSNHLSPCPLKNRLIDTTSLSHGCCIKQKQVNESMQSSGSNLTIGSGDGSPPAAINETTHLARQSNFLPRNITHSLDTPPPQF